MNIFEKIQNVRVKLSKANLKMTGFNKNTKQNYFELGDFLPALNAFMAEEKMTAIATFSETEATLTAINCEKPEDKYAITSPMGSAKLPACHEVQNIGAVETYQRRYLYSALFDINDKDALDATLEPQKATQPATSGTAKQTPVKQQTKPAEAHKGTEKQAQDKPFPEVSETPKKSQRVLQMEAIIKGSDFRSMDEVYDFIETRLGERQALDEMSAERYNYFVKAISKAIESMKG